MIPISNMTYLTDIQPNTLHFHTSVAIMAYTVFFTTMAFRFEETFLGGNNTFLGEIPSKVGWGVGHCEII